MPEHRQQWRTFSLKVNPKTRKSVAVQSRFPLSVGEWDALFTALERLRDEDLFGMPQDDAAPAPVSVRMVEKLRNHDQ